MTLSEMRAEARKALTGKWGKAALLTLVYGLIMFVISFVLGLIPTIGQIAATVINLPIGYGFIVSMIRLKRGEDVGYTDFLTTAFSKNFGKVWAVFGNQLLKLIIPIVLVVIFFIMLMFGGAGSLVGTAYNSSKAAAGFGVVGVIGLIGYIASLIYLIVEGFLYSLSYFILYDNTDKPAKEIVEESARLMRGNRWKYFFLPLTFIGWAILASLTFGIGYLWLTPYLMVATVCFYESLAGTKTNVEAEPVVEEKPEEVEEPKEDSTEE